MSGVDRARCAQVLARVAAGEVLCAPRDASCYNYPATSGGLRSHPGGKYHVVTTGETAACSPVLLVVEQAAPVASVDRVLLCRRQACYVRWFPARGQP